MHAHDCRGNLFAKLMCCELRIRSFARSTGGHPIELQSGGLRPFVIARWVSIRGTHVPPTGDSTFDSKLGKVPIGPQSVNLPSYGTTYQIQALLSGTHALPALNCRWGLFAKHMCYQLKIRSWIRSSGGCPLDRKLTTVRQTAPSADANNVDWKQEIPARDCRKGISSRRICAANWKLEA